ncbi:hypothetical protein FJ364_02115 [Candidatus Dependentiae bacterium]|nr:hypothetical protein [Candidatus Dependentiae bacterium]
MKKNINMTLAAAIAMAIVGWGSVSISSIVAGKATYFGLCNMLMPALAAIGGIGASVLMTLFIILKFCSGKLLVTKGLPTLAAVYSAQSTTPSRISLALNVILPICSAIAFIVHPVGNAAVIYTLFWIIPIGCELMHRLSYNTLFTRMLAATFVAHAVGSVMWLYFMPTTAATWLGLLAVVPAERLVFASGATLATLLFAALKQLATKTTAV